MIGALPALRIVITCRIPATMSLSSLPSLATISDPQQLEIFLAPHECLVTQIQAALFFRNLPALTIPYLLVNLLFWIIYKLSLGVIPTLFLLLTIKALIEIAITAFRRPLLAIFVKQINDPNSGTYKIYSLPEVCLILSKIGQLINFLISVLTPRGDDLSSASVLLISAAVMFFLFLITGTFWANYVLVNLAFFLPAILFHPVVKPFLERGLGLDKPKVE
jgi:hypothetical protein